MYNVTPSIRLSGAVFESQDEDHHANRSTLLGFGGQYLLSVRTLLYTQVDIVNNKGKMQTGLNAQATDALSGLPAGTTTGINIGINHTF